MTPRFLVVVAALLLLGLFVALVLDLGHRATGAPEAPPPAHIEVIPKFPQPSTTTTSTTSTTVVAEPAAVPLRAASVNPPLTPQPGDLVATFDRIADCESGEWDAQKRPIPGTARWDDRRAGYEGGVHFLNSTWLSAGGGRFAPHAYLATRLQQIEIAIAWLRRTDWSQWPTCSRKLGLR